MTLTIVINTPSAASEANRREGIALLLEEVARRLRRGEDFTNYGTRFDVDGSDVGRARFVEFP
jgi:hypothetical protein